MRRRIRLGSGIASEPFKSFYFLDFASILNGRMLYPGIIRNSVGRPLGGIGQPKEKI